MRIASRNAGNKETIRRGALMKMLATSAETIPLWVGRESEASPPPLAGAVPPEANYVAACGDMAAALVRSPDGDENWILAEVRIDTVLTYYVVLPQSQNFNTMP